MPSLVGSEMCIRDRVGKTVNAARNEIEAALEQKKKELSRSELEAKMQASAVDVTLPGRAPVSYTHLTLPTIYSV